MRTIALTIFVSLSSSILAIAIFPPFLRPTILDHPTITDMSGSKAQVDLPARRVVSFPIVLAPYVTVDGGPSHLLGVSPASLKVTLPDAVTKIYPSLAQTPQLPGWFFNPLASNTEDIMRMNPGAVISFYSPSFIDPLKAAGAPNVVAISYQPNTAAANPRIIKLLGDLTGHQERVGFLLARYAAERKKILGALPAGRTDPPKVIFLNILPGRINLLTASFLWLNDKISALGARNIGTMKMSSSNYQNDPEEILRLDPDVIFALCDPPDRKCLGDLYNNPRFQLMGAVRNRQVYRVPDFSLTNQVIEEPIMLDWFAEILYPEQMQRRFREQYKETYWADYHYAFSDDAIDDVLFLNENLQSAGYARFRRDQASTVDPKQ